MHAVEDGRIPFNASEDALARQPHGARSVFSRRRWRPARQPRSPPGAGLRRAPPHRRRNGAVRVDLSREPASKPPAVLPGASHCGRVARERVHARSSTAASAELRRLGFEPTSTRTCSRARGHTFLGAAALVRAALHARLGPTRRSPR